MRKENRSFNALKGIACLLVVLNHYHGTGLIGDILYCISHFGVPVFFLISGYFLYSEQGVVVKKIPKKIKHIADLLLLHIGLYILDFITERILLDGNIIRKDIVIGDILSYFTISNLKSAILWSTSIFGAGQWFLVALLEGYIVIYTFYKIRAGRFIEKYGFIIAMILFCIHIPLRIVLVRSGIDEILGVKLTESLSVRNVWFDAIPFMLIGLCIHKNQEKDIIEKTNGRLLPMLSLVALFASIGEFFLTGWILQEQKISSVLYIGTILSVCFAFLWAVKNPDVIRNKHLGNGIEFLGKNLSMMVYFIHVIVGTYIEQLIHKNGGGIGWILQYFLPILVMIASLIISYAVFKLNSRLNKRNSHNPAHSLIIAICVSVLLLPNGTIWQQLGEGYVNNGEAITVILNSELSYDKYGTILVSIQDDSGMTVDVTEMPIQQFIGGGVAKADDQMTDQRYKVSYIDSSTVSVTTEGLSGKVRIWGK